MSQELGRDGVPEPRPGPHSAVESDPSTPPGGTAAGDLVAPTAPWVSPGGSGEIQQPGTRAAAAIGTSNPAWRPPVQAGSGAQYQLRPGGIPLRPLDLGDILDGTFGTIRRNPKATLLLSALLVTLQQLLVVGAEVLTGDIPTPIGLTSSSASLQVAGGLGALLGVLLSAVIGAVLTGMIVVVVSEDVLGRQASISDVWRRVRPRLWALLAAAVIAGVLPFVGLLLLVVPGVILWGAWSLTMPALILERLGPIKALRRSWQLVWSDFFRVWGIRALAVLLGSLMQNLVVIPFAVLGLAIAAALSSDSTESLPLIAIGLVVLGSIVGGTVTAPFLAGVVALLYVDRRMRSEGLDIVLQLRMRRARRMSNGLSTAGPAEAGAHADAHLAGWGGVPATGRPDPGTSPL